MTKYDSIYDNLDTRSQEDLYLDHEVDNLDISSIVGAKAPVYEITKESVDKISKILQKSESV